MSDGTTFLDLLSPGETGDAEVQLRLTARQAAALQLVISLGVKLGAGGVAYAAAGMHGVHEHLAIAFPEAEARLGLALAGVLPDGAEHKPELSAMLATLEQQKAALQEGGD